MSDNPTDPNQPISEKLAHAPVGARVPDRLAAGVFSTGQIVLDSPKEFVIDFLQGLTRPFRVNARVILAPATMAELITALKENLAKYTSSFGPPPPLPPRPPNERRLSITEIYENFKINEELLAGNYANSVLIGHAPAEFFFDFITGFYPTAAVSSRVFLPAPAVPRFLGTLEGAYRQYLSRVQTAPPQVKENMQILLIPAPRKIVQTSNDRIAVNGLRFIDDAPEIDLPLRPFFRDENDSLPIRVKIDSSVRHDQGYTLDIAGDGISITARSRQGVYYAFQTLAQLLRQDARSLPSVLIEDHPDFPVRGVMLDVSRDKVPSMQTMYELIGLLASWKINQVQLYIEHTFAYQNHRTVWKDASPFTADQIRSLDAYCRERFIDLVPNQNSFGHMARWLKHPEYRDLAEAPDGYVKPNGTRTDSPNSLNPTDPRSIELLRELYAELLPNFTSKMFNVGCDETWDVGLGKSKAACDERGKERVYLEFLLKVHELVKSHGRTMQFWGDIIMKRPELIAELPKDIIALEWGYDADHPFDADGEQFAKAGVPFYVCPGTSSWNTIVGRTENAIANLRSAAVNGMKHGAIGYLNTDWGDHGHLHCLPISYLPFAIGAAMSWCEASSQSIDFASAVSLLAFGDPTGAMGRVAFDLGNTHLPAGLRVKNATILFRILAHQEADNNPAEKVTGEALLAVEAAIDAAMKPLEQAKMDRPDAELIRAEFRNAAALIKHAARLGRWRKDPTAVPAKQLAEELRPIITEHRRLWLARNRPGGLDDSVRDLNKLLAEYESASSTN